jgi:branched-chain amino acid aminotransferase
MVASRSRRTAAPNASPHAQDDDRILWVGGELVPRREARIELTSPAVLSGINAYEVLSGFWTPSTASVRLFRVRDHLDRLWSSAKVMRLRLPRSPDQLLKGMIDAVAANGYREDVAIRLVCHIVEDAFFGDNVDPSEAATEVFISVTPNHVSALDQGIHVCTSTWRRISDDSTPPRVKSGTNYQNARLAMNESRVNGFEDAILLNAQGKVCELPLANLFLVRGGEIVTPPVSAGILEGITRRTIIEIAPELGLQVHERDVDRSELYVADEVFASTTPRNLYPILSIDRLPVGAGQPGRITLQLQNEFTRLVRRQVSSHQGWLTSV